MKAYKYYSKYKDGKRSLEPPSGWMEMSGECVKGKGWGKTKGKVYNIPVSIIMSI